jgi:hypothetical protein
MVTVQLPINKTTQSLRLSGLDPESPAIGAGKCSIQGIPDQVRDDEQGVLNSYKKCSFVFMFFFAGAAEVAEKSTEVAGMGLESC